MQERNTKKSGEFAVAAAVLFYAFVLAHTAWLADDAYISFRSVDNLIRGHGPVWNPGERVQSFSHPLWFFAIVPLRAGFGSFHGPVLGLSMLCSLLAVALLAWVSRSSWTRRGGCVLLLASSAAFVDYSTSGLENPLSHLILAGFFFCWLRQREGSLRSGLLVGLLAGLAALNRHDTALVYLPPLLLELGLRVRNGASGAGLNSSGSPSSAARRASRLVRHALAMAAGFLPLVAWTGFALIYYGFPFPNTAYAKLGAGIPRMELLRQGGFYLQEVWMHDPVTGGIIVAGIVAGLAQPVARLKALVLGVILYLAYVLWIGGDFMSGRFLSLPCFASALILAEASIELIPRSVRWGSAAALAILAAAGVALAPHRTPLLSPFNKPRVGQAHERSYKWHGIVNERAFYYVWTGLLRRNPEERRPAAHPGARTVERLVRSRPSVIVRMSNGLAGWKAGDHTYIVDLYALSDPLLARLPCIQVPEWRIGHYQRRLPGGYLRSLVFDENRIEDPAIAAYYDRIRTVTRGRLFSRERLAAIAYLNTHLRPSPIAPERFTAPGPDSATPGGRHFRAEDLRSETGQGLRVNGGDPFTIHWRQPRHANAMEIAPPPAGDWLLKLSRKGRDPGLFMIQGSGGPSALAESTQGRRFAIPELLARLGYHAISFVPDDGDEASRTYSIRLMKR